MSFLHFSSSLPTVGAKGSSTSSPAAQNDENQHRNMLNVGVVSMLDDDEDVLMGDGADAGTGSPALPVASPSLKALQAARRPSSTTLSMLSPVPSPSLLGGIGERKHAAASRATDAGVGATATTLFSRAARFSLPRQFDDYLLCAVLVHAVDEHVRALRLVSRRWRDALQRVLGLSLHWERASHAVSSAPRHLLAAAKSLSFDVVDVDLSEWLGSGAFASAGRLTALRCCGVRRTEFLRGSCVAQHLPRLESLEIVVTSLAANAAALPAMLPPPASLQHLRTLRLVGNELSPVSFDHLLALAPHLHALEFSHQIYYVFGEPMGVAAFERLCSAASQLRELNLLGATLCDEHVQSIVRQLPQLEDLRVSRVADDAVVGLLAHVPRLHTLFIGGFKGARGYEALATHLAASLRHLSLWFRQGQAALVEAMFERGDFSRLHTLAIASDLFASGDCPSLAALARAPRLHALEVHRLYVASAQLERLSALRTLELSSCMFASAQDIDFVEHMPQLRSIRVRGHEMLAPSVIERFPPHLLQLLSAF